MIEEVFMLRTVTVSAAAALALLLLVDTADAGRGRGGGGGKHYSGGGHGGHSYRGGGHGRSFHGGGKSHYAYKYHNDHKHRYYRNRVIVGVPYAYGVYSYAQSCHWLRHRAAVTGSPYWWDRYQACIDGYYYD